MRVTGIDPGKIIAGILFLLILACQSEDNTEPVERVAIDHECDRCDRIACEQDRARLGIVVTKPTSGTEVACLCPGDDYYVDRYWLRSHVLRCIPKSLNGAVWIKTSNTGDKSDSGGISIRFTVDVPVDVFLAFDSRRVQAGHIPAWVKRDFRVARNAREEALWIDITEPDPTQEFDVFYRSAPAGEIVLGGNRAKGLEGVDLSMYVVVMRPQVEAPTR